MEELMKKSLEKQNSVLLQSKELQLANQTIEELQHKMLNQTNDKMSTSNDSFMNNEDKLSKAIEQLSLIILSKDKGNTLGDDTKKFIKEVYGENVAKNLNVFDKKLKELFLKNEKLNKELLEEVKSTPFFSIFFKKAIKK